jgi:hypothetical protein
VAEIPWGHNIILMEKVKDSAQRLWYAAKTIEHGWSRTVLTVHIETDLYRRQGKAVTNFSATLPGGEKGKRKGKRGHSSFRDAKR